MNASRLFAGIVLTSALILAGCKASDRLPSPAEPAALAPVLTTPDAVDPHSYARPLEARVTHIALELGVNFEAKEIDGVATLDIAKKPDAKEIILDDLGLRIESVNDVQGALEWEVGPSDPILGAPLKIALGPLAAGHDTARITIRYKSAPGAEALQWLTPQQTAGKTHPFLFSQGQPILNRSWIPLQDSPGIRATWEAKVRVAKPLAAVMSAARSEPVEAGDGRIFSFRMDHPVPSYLIALAVGDLAFRDLGPRTGVWAEPATLDAAAAEFADTEKMMDTTEKLYGPYRWGRYDLLVLPPAFPFGGMENPMLTFLTPTLIAGDKSLVSVVAHELAHSWSGNLATNATWNDFWLNEGITTYAERRVVEEIYGVKTAQQQVVNGLDNDLAEAFEDAGGATSADTRLRLDLKGRHPDDGTSNVAYEKGAAFLRVIEAAVGRERFDQWLRGWFDRHAFQPVTTDMFVADLRQHLVKGDKTLEAKLAIPAWIDGPGLPPNNLRPPGDLFTDQEAAATAFAQSGTIPANWPKWTTDERLRFFNRLPRTLPAQRLAGLEQALGLNSIRNADVRYAWLDLAVGNRFDPAIPSLEQFLASQGRGRFVRPLFQKLAADTVWGRPIAVRLYAANRAAYHSLVTREVDKLGL